MSRNCRNNGRTDLFNLAYTQEIPLSFDLGPKDHIIVKLDDAPKPSKVNGKAHHPSRKQTKSSAK